MGSSMEGGDEDELGRGLRPELKRALAVTSTQSVPYWAKHLYRHCLQGSITTMDEGTESMSRENCLETEGHMTRI